MKRIFFLVFATLLLCSQSIWGQTNNFNVSEDGKVYWQKVYDTFLDRETLLDVIINDGNFLDINDSDVITFRFFRKRINVEEFGYDRGAVPMYVVLYDVSGFVTIQYKEGRYRTTIDNIVMVKNITTSLGKEGEEQPLEAAAVSDGKLKKSFSKTPAKIYDAYFSKLFQFQKKSYIDDEW